MWDIFEGKINIPNCISYLCIPLPLLYGEWSFSFALKLIHFLVKVNIIPDYLKWVIILYIWC